MTAQHIFTLLDLLEDDGPTKLTVPGLLEMLEKGEEIDIGKLKPKPMPPSGMNFMCPPGQNIVHCDVLPTQGQGILPSLFSNVVATALPEIQPGRKGAIHQGCAVRVPSIDLDIQKIVSTLRTLSTAEGAAAEITRSPIPFIPFPVSVRFTCCENNGGMQMHNVCPPPRGFPIPGFPIIPGFPLTGETIEITPIDGPIIGGPTQCPFGRMCDGMEMDNACKMKDLPKDIGDIFNGLF